MATTRDPCPWHCGGEVATDDVRRTTAHSVPLCPGYLEFLATASSAPTRVTIDLLGDSGELVKVIDARKS